MKQSVNTEEELGFLWCQIEREEGERWPESAKKKKLLEKRNIQDTLVCSPCYFLVFNNHKQMMSAILKHLWSLGILVLWHQAPGTSRRLWLQWIPMSWEVKPESFKQEDNWAPKNRHLMHLDMHTWISGGQGQTGNYIPKNTIELN